MKVVINNNGSISVYDDFGYDVLLRPNQIDALVSELEFVKQAIEAETAAEFDYESSEEK